MQAIGNASAVEGNLLVFAVSLSNPSSTPIVLDLTASGGTATVGSDYSANNFEYSTDGQQWTRHPWQMEVSGFHHNVFGGFLSLRIGLFAAGRGEVRMRGFRYRGLGTI